MTHCHKINRLDLSWRQHIQRHIASWLSLRNGLLTCPTIQKMIDYRIVSFVQWTFEHATIAKGHCTHSVKLPHQGSFKFPNYPLCIVSLLDSSYLKGRRDSFNNLNWEGLRREEPRYILWIIKITVNLLFIAEYRVPRGDRLPSEVRSQQQRETWNEMAHIHSACLNYVKWVDWK